MSHPQFVDYLQFSIEQSAFWHWFHWQKQGHPPPLSRHWAQNHRGHGRSCSEDPRRTVAPLMLSYSSLACGGETHMGHEWKQGTQLNGVINVYHQLLRIHERQKQLPTNKHGSRCLLRNCIGLPNAAWHLLKEPIVSGRRSTSVRVPSQPTYSRNVTKKPLPTFLHFLWISA